MPQFFSIGLLTTILLLISCNRQETSTEAEYTIFFSLKEYIKSEADRLNEQQAGLDKTISINNKTEHRQVTQIDFHKELSFFSKADINKLAWADKYRVDTVFFANNSPKSIHYMAEDSTLKTQEIHLYFQANQTLDSLNVRSKSETALASNENWLQFEAAKGYHIVTEQNNISGDLTKIEVTSVFTAKN